MILKKRFSKNLASKIFHLKLVAIGLFLALGLNSQAQYGPLYWDLRDYDSLPNYRIAMKAFQENDTLLAFQILDSVAKACQQNGHLRRNYQAINEMAAMNYISGSYQRSANLFVANLNQMQAAADSLHYEYAIALRFMNYLAHYGLDKSATRLHYAKRQYEILHLMNDSSALMSDCLGDLAFSYMTSGMQREAIETFYEARKMALKLQLTEPLIRVEHTLVNQLATNEPQLAFESFEQQFIHADRLYYRDSLVLVTLAYTLAEKALELEKTEKAAHYFHLADTIKSAIKLHHPKLDVALPLVATRIYSHLGQKHNFEYYLKAAKIAQQLNQQYNTLSDNIVNLEIAEAFLAFETDSVLFYANQVDLASTKEYINAKLLVAEALLIKKDFNQVINELSNVKLIADSLKEDAKLLEIYLLELKAQNQLFAHQKNPSTANAIKSTLAAAQECVQRLAIQASDPNSLLKLATNQKTLAATAFSIADNDDKPSLELAWKYLNETKTFQLRLASLKTQQAAHLIGAEPFWLQKLHLEETINAWQSQKSNAIFESDQQAADSLHRLIQDQRIDLLMLHYRYGDRLKENKTQLFSPLSLQEIQNKLDSQTCMIDVLINDSSYFLLCIQKNKLKLIASQDVSSFKRNWKTYYRDLKTGQNTAQSARKLAQNLIMPFSAEIAASERLIFIPDDFLFKTPLALLPFSTSQDLLLDKVSISYQYSAYLWLQSVDYKDKSTDRLLALAPVFGKTTRDESLALRGMNAFSENISALPYSLQEVESIAHLFEQQQKPFELLLENNATKAAFLKALPEADIVHFATHGFAPYARLNTQGILLAADSLALSKGMNSSFLHEGELAVLNSKAKLAVLSSCSSGLGELAEGEGVLSLPRSLLQAGIPQVVASLWPVNDKATAQLMLKFYEELLSQKTASEALQAAKISCRNLGMPAIDWAAFILIGE
ncbi:MAG: CHAT domain-containing protein [Bacteroidales bacterium]|jgi:CHAT domain-containing protein|nr:CHAT domain-containing protein [Bacteroidales bacterium]